MSICIIDFRVGGMERGYKLFITYAGVVSLTVSVDVKHHVYLLTLLLVWLTEC